MASSEISKFASANEASQSFIELDRSAVRPIGRGRKRPHTFADARMQFMKRECERDPPLLTRQKGLQAPDR